MDANSINDLNQNEWAKTYIPHCLGWIIMLVWIYVFVILLIAITIPKLEGFSKVFGSNWKWDFTCINW